MKDERKAVVPGGGVSAPKAEKAEKAPKEPKVLPTKVGESHAGYTIVAGPVDGRWCLKTEKGRFGVYTLPWQKEGKIIFRPVVEQEVALSVMKTGKLPEKVKVEKAPKAEKTESPKK